MNFSYTMLKSFMECEYQYYLRYVKKVALDEGSASVYGSTVHRTIQLGYDNDLKKEDWINLFKREWISQCAIKKVVFNTNTEYIKKLKDGKELVAEYYDTYVHRKKAPQHTELRFGAKENVILGNHVLVGIMDQISSKGEVVDLKTGAKPTQSELDFDLQFTIYSFAYRKIFGKQEKGLILRHLGTMKDLKTTRTEKDFEVLNGEIDKIELKLRDNNFVRHIDRNCSRCYFVEKCLDKERAVNRWVK